MLECEAQQSSLKMYIIFHKNELYMNSLQILMIVIIVIYFLKPLVLVGFFFINVMYLYILN